MLYLCVMKNMTQKKNGKQLCSTFTVSYHVKCEGEEDDESEMQTGGKGEESDFLHPCRSDRDGDRGVGSEIPPPPPLHLHPLLPLSPPVTAPLPPLPPID